LHGFVKPQIHEYDTLTSEERWNEYADVILANPPFMSPKGGIKPHKRFSVQSNRSEVLFVDYMAEHLTPNGRAAIIVPEGIIFQSAGAYKQLRKYLIEHNYLWAVVSLPAGVFNPYAGVKTSILFLDKSLAKKTDKVLFVKVEADGFDLGAQRRPVDRNDLPEALKVLKEYKESINQTFRVSPTIKESDGKETLKVLIVNNSKLAETGDYNLSADRYREVIRVGKQTHSLVALKDICEINPETAVPMELFGNTEFTYVDISSVENGSGKIDYSNKLSTNDAPSRARRLIKENDVLLSTVRPNLKAFAFIKNLPEKSIASTGFAVLRATKRILPEYLYAIIFDDKTVSQMILQMEKGAYPSINQSDVEAIQIPLPPLEIQRQIVDEIAAHQRIIDGARQVIEGWKPDIEIDEDWETVELENLCENLDSQRKPVTKSDRVQGQYPYYGASGIVDYVEDYIFDGKYLLVSEDGANLLARSTPIAFSVEGKVWVNNHAHILKFEEQATQSFVEMYLNSIDLSNFITGAAQPKLTQANLNKLEIPLPPLEIQREIVARIESERKIVEGNRELIRLYESKVKKVIERVWEA
jgi:type I restriction enzyme M protein